MRILPEMAQWSPYPLETPKPVIKPAENPKAPNPYDVPYREPLRYADRYPERDRGFFAPYYGYRREPKF